MLLRYALRLGEREVVAFVGAGGKTTAVLRLAQEIVASGGRVITSTTTRIFSSQTQLAPYHVPLDDPARPRADLAEVLQGHPHVLLTGPVDAAEGKATGVAPELIGALWSEISDPRLSILVEADGSRMRPFKAPAGHEPVVPACATLVVPVVGADVFGRELCDDHVHRAGQVARLSGAQPGSRVSARLVASVLLHPQGGAKGLPPGARWTPLINKVETDERLAHAREVARIVLAERGAETLLAAVRSADPVRERWGPVAAVVLAAGASTRMRVAGEIKQLLDWGGRPLVAHVTDVALQSQAVLVLVVLGNEAERVSAALAQRDVLRCVNGEWSSGQSSSLRAGLRALPSHVQAALFMLVDQPMVSARLVDAILQKYRESGAGIVAPRAAGRRANPVLFDRSAWPELMRVAGDAGGRALFDVYADRVAWVDWSEEILVEIDTPADYAQHAPGRDRRP